jgi:hypothetical protein
MKQLKLISAVVTLVLWAITIALAASTKPETDIAGPRQFIACRRGLLRPERAILISPRLHRLLEGEKCKGYKIEVTRLV